MKKIAVILFLFFNSPVFSQAIREGFIFNDTSLFFVEQIDNLRPIVLSKEELEETELLLRQAITEFNQVQQRYADSVNPKKKKSRQQALEIDANRYFFKLVPVMNKENQKRVLISGDCKDYFWSGKKRKNGYDPEWKKKFINGNHVIDGGSCFIYVVVNLTLNSYDQLTQNGRG